MRSGTWSSARLPKVQSTLRHSVQAWGSEDFANILRDEVLGLPAGILPLERAVTPGSHVDTSKAELMVMHTSEASDFFVVRFAVFFTEIVASCGCGDEPMHLNAQCIIQCRLEKSSATCEFSVVDA